MDEANDTPTLEDYLDTLLDIPENGVAVICIPGSKGWTQYALNDRLLKRLKRQKGQWYQCGSIVKIPEQGQPVRRRTQDCLEFQNLLFDDIGTKATAPPIVPTVKLETSEGNQSWIIALEPIDLTDPERLAYVEACQRAIAAAGYCDAGALGVSRVFRIPGSVNTKPGRNNWETRIVEWNPDVVMTLEDVMTQLGLEPIYKASVLADTHLSAGEIPDDIHDPVVDWLADVNRLGDLEEFGYKIRCPWAHEHTTGDTVAGYSPLGHGAHPLRRTYHCFHEHCQGRTGADFLNWVAEQGGPRCDPVGLREVSLARLSELTRTLSEKERTELLQASLPALSKRDLPDCSYTRPNARGEYFPTASQPATEPNIAHVMGAYSVQARMNMMSKAMECRFTDERLATACDHQHEQCLQLITDGCQRVGIKSRTEITDAIALNALRHQYHPMEDWIKGLEWDGVSRFQQLCETVEVAPGYEEVWPVYLRRWLIQTVQAVCGWREPKQIPQVLVLCGPQGCGKTMWLSKLVPFPEWFNEGVHLDLKSHGARDSIAAATRMPICELGELEVTFRKADSGALKAFLARRVDVYRQPYGRAEIEWPRCNTWVGSVNRIDFLVDETGSRRYNPVLVIRCNWQHEIDIGQVWAEVYQWWLSGESWILTEAEDAMRAEQADAFRSVPEAEMVAEAWLDKYDEGHTAMNRAQFLKLIEIPRSNQNMSIVLQVLNRRLGEARRQIRGVQNAWLVPTEVSEKRRKALEREIGVKTESVRFNVENLFGNNELGQKR